MPDEIPGKYLDVNMQGSYYMRTVLLDNKNAAAQKSQNWPATELVRS